MIRFLPSTHIGYTGSIILQEPQRCVIQVSGAVGILQKHYGSSRLEKYSRLYFIPPLLLKHMC